MEKFEKCYMLVTGNSWCFRRQLSCGGKFLVCTGLPRSLLYEVLHVLGITLLPFHIVPDKSPFIVKGQDKPKGIYGNNVTNLLEFKLILDILDPLLSYV